MRLRRPARSPAARAYEEAEIAPPETPWREASYAVVDLETTGLDPKQDEIISFAAVPIDAGRIKVGAVSTLMIRPSGCRKRRRSVSTGSGRRTSRRHRSSRRPRQRPRGAHRPGAGGSRGVGGARISAGPWKRRGPASPPVVGHRRRSFGARRARAPWTTGQSCRFRCSA
jgi:hypothetical protein